MEISKEVKAGAREITAFWNGLGGARRTDPIADLKLLDDLRRFERNDFTVEVPAAPPPPSSGGTGHVDDVEADALSKRLSWLIRQRWQSHGAHWLGATDDAGAYRGEESAASLGDASPS